MGQAKHAVFLDQPIARRQPAGSGSVAVECARFGADVHAVERDPADAERVRRNAARHGRGGLRGLGARRGRGAEREPDGEGDGECDACEGGAHLAGADATVDGAGRCGHLVLLGCQSGPNHSFL